MEYLEARRSLIETRLEEILDRVDPTHLGDQVEHVALSGGKRVRPTVTILACECIGGDPEEAVDFAVGIELVHNASLVIDDIIDDSARRRDRPSAWSAFGHGPAVIASDGLMGEAFDLFSPHPQAMERVTNAIVELGEGEATELLQAPTTEAEYMELARRKTGALFRVAAELGGLAADGESSAITGLGQYAEHVGIAFQIRDDVLDATADAADLGKPTGQDAAMDRPSLIQIGDITPAEANKRAHERADAALTALEDLDVDNTTAKEYLADLATFVVTREH